MTDYTKIRSTYVKHKIKGLAFNKRNRQYIGDLLTIEDIALDKLPKRNSTTSQILYLLMAEYPQEWIEIFKELNSAQLPVYTALFESYKKASFKEFAVASKISELTESFESWEEMQGTVLELHFEKVEYTDSFTFDSQLSELVYGFISESSKGVLANDLECHFFSKGYSIDDIDSAISSCMRSGYIYKANTKYMKIHN